jgi:hypothetical protein
VRQILEEIVGIEREATLHQLFIGFRETVIHLGSKSYSVLTETGASTD